MEARKLLYYLMAFAPAVLMAGIGIHSRTYVDPYEWTAAEVDHARMNAYIPLAIETDEHLQQRQVANEPEARRLALKWIEGAQSGKLRPLFPIAADELSPSGNKAKIFEANGMVARRLIHFADERIVKGKYGDAAHNLILASDCLQALKYSNFMHLFRISLIQANILRRVEQIYPKSDEGLRYRLAACMERMKGDRAAFAGIARKAKVVILEQIRQHKDTDDALKTASKMVPENSFFEQPALAKGRTGDGPSSHMVGQFAIPDQTAEATQCLLADERNRLRISKILSLAPPVPTTR